MKPTLIERKLLWNQYEIMKRLDPGASEAYEKYQAVLADGYQSHYSDIFQDIDRDELSPEDSTFVIDVLCMFEALQRFEQDNPNEAVDLNLVKFEGFEYNSEREAKFARYTRFLIEKERKWDYLNITNFNSHRSVAELYSRMLGPWLKLPPEQRFKLARIHVDEILSERVHPDNR